MNVERLMQSKGKGHLRLFEARTATMPDALISARENDFGRRSISLFMFFET
jgi:hypothetical protein